MAANEPVVSHRKVVAGSDRSFGLVFAGFFCAGGAAAGDPRRAAALVGAWRRRRLRGCRAFIAPRLLHPLNRVWFALGLLLHHVVNPVIMAVMFYGAILPMALLLRALGKDLLRLKREPAAASYWIAREPPAPAPRSMNKQF